MHIHVHVHGAAHYVLESDCLGCVVLLCLVVCLTLLASFFLLHLSLKYTPICTYSHTHIPPYAHTPHYNNVPQNQGSCCSEQHKACDGFWFQYLRQRVSSCATIPYLLAQTNCTFFRVPQDHVGNLKYLHRQWHLLVGRNRLQNPRQQCCAGNLSAEKSYKIKVHCTIIFNFW